MTNPRWLIDPTGLSEKAEKYWKYYAPGLRRDGRLTPDSMERFRQLCRLMALAEAADGEIAAHGVTIKTASGTRRPNPACKVLIDAQRDAVPLLRAFELP
jgi:phage terminase small subunit